MEKFIKEIIQKAGQATMKYFGHARVVYTKENLGDVVTKADLASQRIITRAIKKKYPSHGIVAEEENTSYQTDADYIWYIDPLDGTRNFATHVPLFGINMGLSYKGAIVYGAVYLPVTRELCFARAGKGAFLNGRRILCSNHKKFAYSYGLGPVRISHPRLRDLGNIIEHSQNTVWVSSLGSIAVAGVYIASGRRDWYTSRDGKVWDYAAPSLIMKEAGCKVTNVHGKDWQPSDSNLVVANRYLHKELLGLLQS